MGGCPYLCLWPTQVCRAKKIGIHVPTDVTVEEICMKHAHEDCFLFQEGRKARVES